MQRILIISFTNPNSDPRVYRHIMSLKDHYEVTVAGTEAFQSEQVRSLVLNFPPQRKTLFHKISRAIDMFIKGPDSFYWGTGLIQQSYELLSQHGFDGYLANDIETLPLVLALQQKHYPQAKVVYDAHEYTPREFEELWKWRLLIKPYKTALCQKYMPLADRVVTVCQTIAEEYAKVFGIPQPTVVTNAPFFETLEPGVVNENHIKLIHHGGAVPSRKIELMIDMFEYLDSRFSLDLMLLENHPEYMKMLKSRAAPFSQIQFIPPVPMPQIANKINDYDIGVYILYPSNFNNRVALPNKFFEFVQGRLAIAIGPSPEMARLVKQYSCGVVATEFTAKALAQKLNALSSDDLKALKQQSHRAAKELSAEYNQKVLLELFQGLF